METIPVQRGPHALIAVEDTIWVATSRETPFLFFLSNNNIWITTN